MKLQQHACVTVAMKPHNITHLVTPECRNRPTRRALQRRSAGAPHRNHLSTCHLMVSSAPDAASPCSVCELCDTADEAEQHHAMEDDGAASASLVRCLTLPWFSHSAGDVLQIAPARSLHRRLRCADPTLGRKVTGNQIRMLLHSGFSAIPGLSVARTLESSRDLAFMRRGAMLCSLSMVECVGVVVCIR